MATERSFRYSQLIAFDNVAAGHDGVLSDPSGALVVKPCKQSEIDFYESTSAHPDLIPHIPTYVGKITLGAHTDAVQATGALVLPSETDSDPSVMHGVPDTRIRTDLAVVLENVAADFQKPNILDVKLGARLWDDDAPIDKREKLDKVAEETTSKPLGLRISGMRTYQGAVGNGEENITPDGYKFYDKWYGRAFSVETVAQGFEEYFQLTKRVKAEGVIKTVIKRFIRDLREIESVLEKEESRMYSASLLLVHEGDHQALQDAFAIEENMIAIIGERDSSNDASIDEILRGNSSANDKSTDPVINDDGGHDGGEEEDDEDEIKFPAIQKLKLIDFAHAEWAPGRGPDENILNGIRNTIKILIELVN